MSPRSWGLSGRLIRYVAMYLPSEHICTVYFVLMWFWRNCINAGKVLFLTALIVALLWISGTNNADIWQEY